MSHRVAEPAEGSDDPFVAFTHPIGFDIIESNHFYRT